MDILSLDFLVPVACIAVVADLIRKMLLYTVLLPYRNRFMYWYMKRFSPYYKNAKKLFDELIEKQKEYRATTVTVSESYHLLLECLQLDIRFRSSNELHTINPQDIITGKPFLLPVENFIAYYGKGKNYHKVVVWFNFENGIHLRWIGLMYHEEDGEYSFDCCLAKKIFPGDDDDETKIRTVRPTPVQRMRKIPC